MVGFSDLKRHLDLSKTITDPRNFVDSSQALMGVLVFRGCHNKRHKLGDLKQGNKQK